MPESGTPSLEMKPSFVHLRVHSEYSLIDGVVRIKELAAAVVEKGMPAVAITDAANLFGLVKFYKAASSAGIKPIVACDIWVAAEKENEDPTPLVLIAKNETGYRNLSELLSKAFNEGQVRGRATLRKDWIRAQSEGLLALSAGKDGDVGKALLSGNPETAEVLAQEWLSIFQGDFYL